MISAILPLAVVAIDQPVDARLALLFSQRPSLEKALAAIKIDVEHPAGVAH